MKPEAIRAAACELISEILASPRPANDIINAYTRARRYIGSKDRRALTYLVWGYVRHFYRLNYLYPDKGIAERMDLLANMPEVIPNAPLWVNMEVPDWMIPLIPEAERELPALMGEAQTVLRANGVRDKIQAALLKEGIETQKTTLSPYGLILKKRANLAGSPAFKAGLLEVQDEGSQCVALETGIRAGDKVLDYCAGAGGKSLIFAQMMGNNGMIVAHDVSDVSLKELGRRVARAGATCIRVEKPIKSGLFDHVVVDAPCSGVGTWRRMPDRRFKLTEKELKGLLKTQAEILETAKNFVKKGGFLSYMTCSLLALENSGQIRAFLEKNKDFVLVKEKQFSPARTGTDGLFVAVMKHS